MIGSPSAAALIFPGLDVPHAVQTVDAALRGAGYVRRDERPPRGYEPIPGEWLGFVATAAREAKVALLLAEDLGWIFHAAVLVSRAMPEQPFLAWRRFLGASPVMKFMLGGKPQWKDGEDADLEVSWPVPHEPPLGIVAAESLGLPGRAGDVAGDFESVLRSYGEAVAHPLPHEVALGWVRKTSRLAP